MLDKVPKQNITLIKKNGDNYKNIKAFISTNKIFIEDVKIPIEKNDIISNKLPSGLENRYIVENNGFCQGSGSIPPHYQVTVKSYDSEKQENQSKTCSYNYNYNYNYGENSKTNINSIDKSTNNYNNESKIFDKLKDAAYTLSEGSRDIIVKSISEMEEHYGKITFKEKYNSFIQVAANHMTLFAPFIPVLTNMLTK